ncbi:MAG: tetratricopeptide repeat protein [Rhodospirillaceae bacterium]
MIIKTKLYIKGIFSIAIAVAFTAGQAWAIAGVDFPLEGDIDYTEVQEMIDSGEYEEAIAYLDFEVIEWYPENAEALTLKAYSLRSIGKHEQAMENYIAALASDPTHKGALEYQGELYLMMGNQEAAEANLDKLENLCPRGCEAHAVLQTAIERFRDGEVSWVPPSNRDPIDEEKIMD